jgi:hypothetical protein
VSAEAGLAKPDIVILDGAIAGAALDRLAAVLVD